MVSNEAAVLVISRTGPSGREVLLIRRSQRDGDPWSGQMALPGGRAEPEDTDRCATAVRETREEVGLPPDAFEGTPVFLEERRPGNRPGMVVSVYAATLRPGAESRIVASDEVDTTFWVPLRELRAERRTVELPLGRGQLEVEGYAWGQTYIWGLTFRILSNLQARA